MDLNMGFFRNVVLRNPPGRAPNRAAGAKALVICGFYGPAKVVP